MAELFKNIWNEPFFDRFTKALKGILDDFDEHLFLSQVIDNEWKNKIFLQQVRVECREKHRYSELPNFNASSEYRPIVGIQI